MLNYAIPIIEQLATTRITGQPEILDQIQERRVLAKDIVDYLNGNSVNKCAYYYAVGRLLQASEYRRILLYLPLSDLMDAPTAFRETYRATWYRMLSIRDARENFFEGDTYEVDARPNGRLERVVKCAHLTPWLVEAGIVDYKMLKNILVANHQNAVLLRSFANTWRLLRDRGFLPENELADLEKYTARVVQREYIEPLYVSDKRRAWLHERKQQTKPNELLTPNARLSGPFSFNIGSMRADLEKIQAALKPNEVALVGGSRLRGYGTNKSDLDVFKLDELERNPALMPGSPHAASLYYASLWLSGSEARDLDALAMNYAAVYFSKPDRARAIEQLETGLLQYRLLHKGFVRFYGGYNSVAKGYPEMDGDCAFYDERYRKIATELFAKYVFIPRKTPTSAPYES